MDGVINGNNKRLAVVCDSEDLEFKTWRMHENIVNIFIIIFMKYFIFCAKRIFLENIYPLCLEGRSTQIVQHEAEWSN